VSLANKTEKQSLHKYLHLYSLAVIFLFLKQNFGYMNDTVTGRPCHVFSEKQLPLHFSVFSVPDKFTSEGLSVSEVVSF